MQDGCAICAVVPTSDSLGAAPIDLAFYGDRLRGIYTPRPNCMVAFFFPIVRAMLGLCCFVHAFGCGACLCGTNIREGMVSNQRDE